jgi:hypothetical protein
MIPVLPAILVSATVLVADQVPKLNVTPSCRASADGILGVKQDIESCLQSENSARDQLAKEWSTFTAADRQSCTRLTTIGGTGGTYTELITCLEIKREAAKLPKELKDDTALGQVTR